jgi:hypothetical protein
MYVHDNQRSTSSPPQSIIHIGAVAFVGASVFGMLVYGQEEEWQWSGHGG